MSRTDDSIFLLTMYAKEIRVIGAHIVGILFWTLLAFPRSFVYVDECRVLIKKDYSNPFSYFDAIAELLQHARDYDKIKL